MLCASHSTRNQTTSRSTRPTSPRSSARPPPRPSSRHRRRSGRCSAPMRVWQRTRRPQVVVDRKIWVIRTSCRESAREVSREQSDGLECGCAGRQRLRAQRGDFSANRRDDPRSYRGHDAERPARARQQPGARILRPDARGLETVGQQRRRPPPTTALASSLRGSTPSNRASRTTSSTASAGPTASTCGSARTKSVKCSTTTVPAGSASINWHSSLRF
jgi:hypothetical protein